MSGLELTLVPTVVNTAVQTAKSCPLPNRKVRERDYKNDKGKEVNVIDVYGPAGKPTEFGIYTDEPTNVYVNGCSRQTTKGVYSLDI